MKIKIYYRDIKHGLSLLKRLKSAVTRRLKVKNFTFEKKAIVVNLEETNQYVPFGWTTDAVLNLDLQSLTQRHKSAFSYKTD